MTEAQALNWDAAQNAIADALTEAGTLLQGIPEAMDTTASRHRILMTMNALEDSRDFLAAARARMPETETGR